MQSSAPAADPTVGLPKNINFWACPDVLLWLTRLGLEELCPLFQKNNIAGTELEGLLKKDLKQFGVAQLGHRKRLVKNINILLGQCSPNTVDESKWRKWTSSEVERWLAKNPSLCALVPIFEENDVSGQDLQHLAAKDLKELGVSKELQAVLLEHLEELKLKYSKSSSTSGESGSEEQHQNTNQPDSRSKSLPQSKKDKEGKDDEKQRVVKKAKSVREGKGVENRNSFEREELELGDPISTSSSFNRVCKGTWRGTVVAVKILQEGSDPTVGKKDIFREINILSAMRHPNIISLMGSCFQGDECLLVTEYVDSGTLEDLLYSKSTITATQQLQIVHQISRGVNFMHQSNIVHRDLNPRNILMDSFFQIKICGFGLSRANDHTTAPPPNSSHTASGAYMAPELLDPEPSGKRSDCRVDVYSFGIMLWEIYSRKKPWPDKQQAQLVFPVLQGKRPVPMPFNCPAAIEKLIVRCWDGDFTTRPFFAEICEVLKSVELPPATDQSADLAQRLADEQLKSKLLLERLQSIELKSIGEVPQGAGKEKENPKEKKKKLSALTWKIK